MSIQPEAQVQFDCFLLYNRSGELERVRPLYTALVERGLHPYFDVEHLAPGANWLKYEEEVLADRPVVLLFLGPAGWGPQHRRWATELPARGLVIIPVLLGQVDEKALSEAGEIFRRLQYVLVEGPESPGFEALVTAVRQRLEEERPRGDAAPQAVAAPEIASLGKEAQVLLQIFAALRTGITGFLLRNRGAVPPDQEQRLRSMEVELARTGEKLSEVPLDSGTIQPYMASTRRAIEALLGALDRLKDADAVLPALNIAVRLPDTLRAGDAKKIESDLQKLFELIEGWGKAAPEAAPAVPPPPPAPPDRRLLDLEITTRAVSDKSQADLLGFADYADALADLIKNEQTQKPLTIGVEAPWGMGKTRLMRMIRERLFTLDGAGARTDLPSVWFDAWKYDKEESLWAALALEVMAQTREKLSTRRWLATWMTLNWRRLDRAVVTATLLNAAVYGALFGAALVAAYLILSSSPGTALLWQYVVKAGAAGTALAALKALYSMHQRLAVRFDEKIARYVKQPKYDERVGFIARFQEDFREIVNVVTGTAAHPLVIFIDDLDRCTPVKAVEVLEAINLLLDSERCVFVIGMDSKAVAASIESKYKEVAALLKASDDPGGLTLGQRFLEKILQIEFHLPPPSNEHMAGYVDAILGYRQAAPADPAAVKREAMAVKETIAREEEKGKSLDEAARSEAVAQAPERVVREAKVERFAESFDSYAVVRTAVNSAAGLLGNNPRKVKRFVNAFRLQALIANRRKLLEEDVIDLELLAMWLVAETRWPEVMRDFLEDPSLLERAAAARKFKAAYNADPGEVTLRQMQAAADDPRVKRLAEADEAMPVIEELRKRAGERLEDYLHLGRVVAGAKTQAAAAS